MTRQQESSGEGNFNRGKHVKPESGQMASRGDLAEMHSISIAGSGDSLTLGLAAR